ncbi:hypothetical protein D0C36_11120 [Mucilaginibacter conchicola]|uniref:Uncharacterized protein n=1 Tax=Mucilaginibacter conchicola TaxID=2303333 RepID=A0A372NSW0_9SPHI|nr:hypothetical protein D0C36_11120 [Mucilaginibacter conchicola]
MSFLAIAQNDNDKNAGKGPTKNRAKVEACGQKDFFVLNFCFFCFKTKDVAPAAMSRLTLIFSTDLTCGMPK